jgi:hypothetical protein
MTYASVEEVFDGIDGTRQRLYDRVEGLSDEQSRARPNSNAWSVAEIVEHLSIIEGRLLQMMKLMLHKAESAGARSKGGAVEMKPFTIEHHVERARNEKYTAPEAVRPSGQASIADSLAKLRQSREELRALRPRIEETNLAGATYPHPAFGPLNFYEWLAFIGVHEERHLRQIESVLSS